MSEISKKALSKAELLKEIYKKLAGDNPALDLNKAHSEATLLRAIADVELTFSDSGIPVAIDEMGHFVKVKGFGKYQDPTCSAIFNAKYSDSPVSIIDFNDEDDNLKITIEGINLGIENGSIFVPFEYVPATKTTVLSVLEIGENTVLEVDNFFSGYDEYVPIVFQIGNDVTGSHAEGKETIASGSNSHAEGSETTASGDYSHAEGRRTTASGSNSHAEGGNTTASGDFSHAEGFGVTASGSSSHAEGLGTTASGSFSHAEGKETKASGSYSHAEGGDTTASGYYSHSGGKGYNNSNKPEASGAVSFVHQEVTSGNGIRKADADNSAILGGTNNSTNASAPRSVVLGGNGQNAVLPDTVYLPQLQLKPVTLPTSLNANHKGLICFDTADSILKCWNGSEWKALFT